MSGSVRKPSHAGSWYSNDGKYLKQQITGWFDDTQMKPQEKGKVRAVIGPHAGFRFSGPTAAYSYRPVNPDGIERVILLGPSHHAYIPGAEVSKFVEYSTPLGKVEIDRDVVHEFKESRVFGSLDKNIDEAEHSLEMHLPIVQEVFERCPFKIVPILVGRITAEDETKIGAILAKYLEDPSTLVAVSTDFCHWGRRFGYTFFEEDWGAIHESIEKLDKLGIEAIKSKDPLKYREYQEQYRNTICGRAAVSCLLNGIDQAKNKDEIVVDFPYYSQSSQSRTAYDSSVSYAAGVISV